MLAAKHPVMHRIAPTTDRCPAPDVNNAQTGKPCIKGVAMDSCPGNIAQFESIESGKKTKKQKTTDSGFLHKD